MATITIGGRDLKVRRPTVGFWDRCVRFDQGGALNKTVAEFIEGATALIFEAVQGNEGVTEAWLRDNLSFPPADEWGRLIVACGFATEKAADKADTQPGEAQTQ